MSDSAEQCDPRDDDNLIHMTPNRLLVLFLLGFTMTILVSAGIGWIFAGISADRSNRAIAKSSRNGLSIIYNADTTRCLAAFKARNVAIHNARLQKAAQPGVQIPAPPTPCKVSVIDPNDPHGTLGHPVEVTTPETTTPTAPSRVTNSAG